MAQKYVVSLDSTHLFNSVVIETAGVIGPKSLIFLKDLGTRLGQETREETVQAYLLQRLSIAVQRRYAVSVMGCARADRTL